MDGLRKQQVSLRGASAKEISRDALLEKVTQEREFRNYMRRATAASLFIQRVWRRYISTKVVAVHLREEWQEMLSCHPVPMSRAWISSNLLRPFLFFVTTLATRRQRFDDRDVDCMQICFRILLESINSNDAQRNFCTLATCDIEERRTWTYQAKKLISLCVLILSECDYSYHEGHQYVVLTSMAMRFVVSLTDLKGWKALNNITLQEADMAVKDLVCYMCSEKNDRFLITASAITLALRPFNSGNMKMNEDGFLDLQFAAEQYCVLLLTIPWFTQRLPAVLLSAIKHKSILLPCFRQILISKEKILEDISKLNNLGQSSSPKMLPPVGWALANVICLAVGVDSNSEDSGKFTQGLDYVSYLRVVIILAKDLLTWFEGLGWIIKENQAIQVNGEPLVELVDPIPLQAQKFSNISYTDLLKPVCQQWHLMKLLILDKSSSIQKADSSLPEAPEKCELTDVAYFYSYMLRIFTILNPVVGSMPILNMLSFTPGFLLNLWAALEKSFFAKLDSAHDATNFFNSNITEDSRDRISKKKKKGVAKNGGTKWVNVLNKITGKSQGDIEQIESVNSLSTQRTEDDPSDVWDIESLRRGPEGLTTDSSHLIHLFCATYSHLLLVLDDIEFYEKQVPFTLEQQRRIASMLNTLVYNALSHNVALQNRPLMDAAIRCLHLLYERDCRHQFCPPALWLSPAKKNRPPIAVAARTHEVLSTNLGSDDSLVISSMHSVITTTPHIFPFEERVQMFRELISMDKVSRRMAGEMIGPGPQAVEVVIRRSHIVEDGFQQLNPLGSRLKSSIHVSFVSECGLPEAGLDYGGLSKEFLTDIAKAAFAPDYGLFTQTSTSDRLLVPNSMARCVDNGFQMIEFLGRVVGKALYEGILLDYSFSHVFVQKLLGRYSFIDELSALDPELYKNLMYVKHYDGDVKDLSLDFTVTEELPGKRHVVELKAGGKDVNVTNDNKLQYIYAMADYKLNRQVLPLSNAFYRGLTDLISPSWLKLFNASEFNQLLSGGNHDIDVDDLRNNTRYTGGYTEGSRTVKLFWEVIREFEPKERCMLMKFVTSCSRAPLLGFKHLQPSFTIHKVACDLPLWATFGGQDVDRLPSASTCYNTLKLPTYKRSGTLRTKLLYAINSNAGFELS
ncbi:E3 ubiquitin-protein ligase UPL7 isoform X2 [Cynara cardunculus var. scolymus]|uniref:E3 ubiquitin-protein ligase UPL7 isoform X2 n=1 Tax=Cynara cardunculus var. scolymus TaxID=59895 RepID=UPI000D626602|nr:E3 ubiquitin-protein ligase UPL7 isoform X2 [Cynara cardunculus var. scolymus]